MAVPLRERGLEPAIKEKRDFLMARLPLYALRKSNKETSRVAKHVSVKKKKHFSDVKRPKGEQVLYSA